MRNEPPNPYIDLRLDDLNRVFNERAKDLLDGRHAGRRDLAYLLIAASRKIAATTAHPNSPARVVRTGAVTALDAYGSVLEQSQKTLRYWLINQAIDAIGGLPAGPARDQVVHLATENDEGCRKALADLDQKILTPSYDIDR